MLRKWQLKRLHFLLFCKQPLTVKCCYFLLFFFCLYSCNNPKNICLFFYGNTINTVIPRGPWGMGKVLEGQKNVLNILNYLIKFKINTIYCITTYIKTHICSYMCPTYMYICKYIFTYMERKRKESEL